MAFKKREPPVRIYVRVNSDFDSAGNVTPKAIIWSDGRVFKIDSIRDYRPASTLGKGHKGNCYTVMIRGEEKHLFFEKTNDYYPNRVGRWWVETSAH